VQIKKQRQAAFSQYEQDIHAQIQAANQQLEMQKITRDATLQAAEQRFNQECVRFEEMLSLQSKVMDESQD
jgi:hypothetical protein